MFRNPLHTSAIQKSQYRLLPPPLSLSPPSDYEDQSRTINISANSTELDPPEIPITSAESSESQSSGRTNSHTSENEQAETTTSEKQTENLSQGDQVMDEINTGLIVTVPGTKPDHYFDTYSMFSQLHRAGFTDDQAIVVMKCVRGLLTEELLRAKETYLSTADMENEAYLFEAACSELRTEIQNSRKSQTLLAQTETAALQREYASAHEYTNEEISNMTNEVGMELNERKNSTKVDSRRTELQIQELNNRITIAISSDLRSEVESLRWQTTRRGLFTIGVVAVLILTALSYRNESEQRAKVAASAVKKQSEFNESEALLLA
ncbi:hypothetical protein V1512DRAFT_271421 [Lipomyces arxii]|uniref:uncharacterized protein n=1 Tax=Lipomyces arxii TaxID=56418 RepID=UPI0034CE0EA9